MPKTFFFPEDLARIREELIKSEKTFIGKPSKGFGGHGIVLMQNVIDIPEEEHVKDMVVQEYITNPLLIEK